MTGNWLILETSGRVGKVGLARGGVVVRALTLDDRRRHARDLASTVSNLFEAEALGPANLTGVVVGRGPGSYTGLRVGIMSAKALCYATGCELRAVDTFAAIAEQAPAEAMGLWVIADALQGQVYAQPFVRGDDGWKPAAELRIEPMEDWRAQVQSGDWITGPGAMAYAERLPQGCRSVAEADCEACVASVFAIGSKLTSLSREESFALEPLYLRGSSAEEKAREKKQASRIEAGADS